MNTHTAHLESFIHHCMTPRPGLHGEKTILASLADWKPKETLGASPRPLASSLYRELITRRVWSIAREQMGYTALPPVELMVSIGGKPYIDVRASFNSLLPSGLSPSLCEKLVNTWLNHLDANPTLHDKIEFAVAHTVAVPNLREYINARYPNLLTDTELEAYDCALTGLTQNALNPQRGLNIALAKIDRLYSMQEKNALTDKHTLTVVNILDLGLGISTTLEECLALGTLPFASIAHHAFIAKSLLHAMVDAGALTKERLAYFKQTLRTIHDEMAEDLLSVCCGKLPGEHFLHKYGHTRAVPYDIVSPPYAEQKDLFQTLVLQYRKRPETPFTLTDQEKQAMETLLHAQGLHISAIDLFHYSEKALVGKAYAEFVVTRHIGRLLHLLTAWGERLGLTREDLSMLPIGEVLDAMTMPLQKDRGSHINERIRQNRQEYELTQTKLTNIIRAPQDIYGGVQQSHAPHLAN